MLLSLAAIFFFNRAHLDYYALSPEICPQSKFHVAVKRPLTMKEKSKRTWKSCLGQNQADLQI